MSCVTQDCLTSWESLLKRCRGWSQKARLTQSRAIPQIVTYYPKMGQCVRCGFGSQAAKRFLLCFKWLEEGLVSVEFLNP